MISYLNQKVIYQISESLCLYSNALSILSTGNNSLKSKQKKNTSVDKEGWKLRYSYGEVEKR